mmetsp:Transcript_37941/g.38632  ORF Transcript_37941/g.38632 Transcript_37941/m.38632 type:complete len:279 (+) Transcript_37941:130-966(+)
MGNGPSQEEIEKVGYRVLGVQPNSPCSNLGLVSFFDFIIVANNIPLKSLDTTFIDIIKSFENQPLPLIVYNTKCKQTRSVVVTPNRNWSGEGMLGVTIRFDTYHNAEEHMCHVLEVEINSPAELAGLQPYKDYLLGTAEHVFKDADVLFEALKLNLEQPMEFYVYNSDTDEVRVVVLMPSAQWGGEGILGASIGHGYLHHIPSANCTTIGRSQEGVYRAVNSPFGMNGETDTTGVSTYNAGNDRERELDEYYKIANREAALESGGTSLPPLPPSSPTY